MAQARQEGPTPPGAQWPMHSWSRPKPALASPGPERRTVRAPSDAIVLLREGGDLTEWRAGDSSAAKWANRRTFVEVVPGSGSLVTRRAFGDVQLHLEFATPPAHGEGQERGNSGVFLMGRYEVQILDSWQNETYADGYAGALFGQVPPLVNAARPPGEWQTFDIIFRRPRFNADGSLAQPARATVLHNGVLVQDNASFIGATRYMALPSYERHEDKLPFALQDHGNRMRFRNIWVRELE
jgi:hypothetical protein